MCRIQILWRMKISNNNYNYNNSNIKSNSVTILTLHWSILQLLWYSGQLSQCGKLQTEIKYYKPLLPRHMFQGNNIHYLEVILMMFHNETTNWNKYSTNSLNIKCMQHINTVLNETLFTNTRLAKLLPLYNIWHVY